MATTTTHTIKQARPSEAEMQLLWKLYRASQRVDNRWGGISVSEMNEEFQRIAPDRFNQGVDREHRMFFLRAWQVLVCSGGFGRIIGALDTYIENMQDPDADHLKWKPELIKQFNDAEILPVIQEAYDEARQHNDELQAANRLKARRTL